MKTFKISAKNVGKRFDVFLTESLHGVTRSQVKKMILSGQALLNKDSASVHEFLQEGDMVTWQETPVTAKNSEDLTQRNLLSAPEIIFEDNDFLVLNKPAGLLVHKAHNESSTLADWLIMHYPGITSVGEENYRAGIIHRLDRDVSGVMVAVKTTAGFAHFKNQFKERKVKKVYCALVYGKMEANEGKIDLPIGRTRLGKFVAHPRWGKSKLQDKDRPATTLYRVEKYIRDYTLLKVQILTGRTHQIRAHLSAIGHPILGDRMYLPKKPIFKLFSKRIKVVNPGNIMLHSFQVGFFDMHNEWREFTSDPPKSFKDFILKCESNVQ